MSEKINSTQRLKLKHFINELKLYKGRHTEFVSVYVPQDYDLNKIINHIFQEQGTASNIKSKATRDNVISALERMIQHLKLFQRTPPNGLVVFSGNVAEREGQQDYKVWSMEPPIPLRIRIYRCDKEFVLDPLIEMTETESVYGLVVMDKRECNIAVLKGKTIVPLHSKTSNVPGKTRAGGQSSVRFARLREGAAKEFMGKLGEMMKAEFLDKKELKGIIVGGPGQTKYEFVDGNFITDQVKRKIISIKDLSYTGEFGLQELVDKAQDVLANEEIAEEKKIVQEFLNKLATQPGYVNYGEAAVFEDLQAGIVDTVLISEIVPDETIQKFEEVALKFGTKISIISTETREGVQLKELGKIACILRYEVQR